MLKDQCFPSALNCSCSTCLDLLHHVMRYQTAIMFHFRADYTSLVGKVAACWGFCEVWLISAYEVLWNSCVNDVTETLNIAAVIQAGTWLKIWCCKVWLGLTFSLGKYSGFLWIPSGKLVQSSNQTKPKHLNRPRVGKNNKKKIRWRVFLRTHCLSRILHL